MNQSFKYAIAASAIAVLTACGGGGDDAPEVSSTTFNINAAIRAATISGQNVNFGITASNGCTGSGVYGVSPANTTATFEGRTALVSTSVLNINYTNCTPAVISNTTTTYYDTNYLPLGSTGDSYLVYTGTINIPTSVKVGDVGVIANAIRYSDSTKAVRTGTAQLSYIVEAESSNTALITVSKKTYNSSNELETTQLTKYRIDASNTLTLMSLSVQYANGVNVVFTRR